MKIRYPKIELSRKITLIIVFLIFILGCSFFCFVIPSYNNIKKIKEDTLSLRDDLLLKQKVGSRLDNSIKNYETAKESEDLLDTIFIKKEDDIDFITSIEDIGSKNNINININFLFESKEVKSFFEIVPLQISAQGSELNLISFLKDLESLNYYINVQKIDLSKKPIKNLSNRNTSNEIEDSVNLFISSDTFWID